MPSLVAALGLAAVSTAVVWAGSSMLERSSQRLALLYGLPPIVQGAIVAAVGSSFPELSSTVLATLLHGEFDLGVGAIVGSAIFNILVIPAIAGLSSKRLASSRDIVFKESLFYMLSIAVVLLVFALAVIYAPVEGERLAGTVTRPLALIPVAVYGLYVFIQSIDVAEHQAAEPPERMSAWKEWGLLVVSLVLIVVAIEGLVRAAIDMGQILGTPSFIWGLTIIAAATSLPDLVVSLQAARAGDGVISLANVLGSNIFDLLVAIPAGVLIAGAAVVDFGAAVPMMGVLTVATILLFTFLRIDLSLANRESVVLLLAYAAFLVFVAEVGGLIDLAAGI